MSAPQATSTQLAAPNASEQFEAEALPWLDDVYRFALSLTRNESDAQDVVQDTYLRAFRSRHTFLPGSDARRWLFTIARNVFLRSRERERRNVLLEDGDAEALAAVRVHAKLVRDDTEELVRRLDLRPALRSALSELEEPFRSAVIVVDVEDQSYDGAAEILGVPIGTVRSRLFRGRRILQERLAAIAREQGISMQQPSSNRSDR